MVDLEKKMCVGVGDETRINFSIDSRPTYNIRDPLSRIDCVIFWILVTFTSTVSHLNTLQNCQAWDLSVWHCLPSHLSPGRQVTLYYGSLGHSGTR